MVTDESIGPHAEFESFLNHTSIYNESVKKLLAQPPLEPYLVSIIILAYYKLPLRLKLFLAGYT